MKKRWRIIALLLVVFLALTGAGAAWLGFMPFGRPDHEEDFMAQQLRRVRYAGPFRSDSEKAIADALPDNPTKDDLRVAYGRHVTEVWTKQVKAFAAVNPGYAQARMAPRDVEARNAYDKACALGEKLAKQFGMADWDDYSGPAKNASTRADFLKESAPLMALLRQTVPAPGKALLDYDPTRIDMWEMPSSAGAPSRMAAARVCFLFADGAKEEGLQTLREAMDSTLKMDWSKCDIGWLLYEICVATILSKAVLPLAEQGLLPADLLADFSDRDKLRRLDAIETAHLVFCAHLLSSGRADDWMTGQFEIDVWRDSTRKDFENYGATSLRDWVDRRAGSSDQDQCTAISAFYRRFEGKHPDLHDPVQAAAFLAEIAPEHAAMNEQIRSIASSALILTVVEADLLSVKLQELRLRHPGKWKSMAQDAAAKYPLVSVVHNGDTVEIHTNSKHPMAQALGRTDSLIHTIR